MKCTCCKGLVGYGNICILRRVLCITEEQQYKAKKEYLIKLKKVGEEEKKQRREIEK